MTTDQRCDSCSHSVRDHEHDYCNVIGCECLNWCQPTPTSLLEEARERVRFFADCMCDEIDPADGGGVNVCDPCKAARALEAAARAEVIREVEAAIAERRSAGRESVYDFCAHEDALAQHILRALSQGGENGGVR